MDKLFKENIPILPFGILDFCKQKLLAPPVEPMNHHISNLNNKNKKKNTKRWKLKRPPSGRGLIWCVKLISTGKRIGIFENVCYCVTYVLTNNLKLTISENDCKRAGCISEPRGSSKNPLERHDLCAQSRYGFSLPLEKLAFKDTC